ncbi:Hypothetical protein FKW44_023515 [Caligus rogercresseyi]|uniref:Uncharacterized protein n=1 Tax=Caligus rogercresseyi TaxID=217165 RepID=A0A7T8GPF8_CALRO|nr:Hypothetical protein FKW44_023515 [Caligus rogercresseyi]
MDMSIDEDDLDVSMYEEPEEITVNKLQEKIKELEGKLAVTTVERDEARAEVTRLENVVKSGQPDPIKSLFGKTMSPTKSNGSGGVKKFQRQMEKIGLQAVSFGVAGRHCNYVLKLVAFELGLEADDVPSTKTLNDWRQKRLPVLIKRQISERILAAEHVGILVDDTALRAPLKMSAIGMVCSSGTYTLVDMVQTDAKNGEQLADQVIRRLELLPQFESFRLKLKYIQSDQGSSQVKANRLIVDHFNNMPERQGLPPLISIYCGLHTIINVDSRLTSYLAASCPKAHELLHNVKILFGCRLRSTWSKSNLTKNLEVLIKMRSPFVTDIGSRIKTTTVNGQALILHEKAVWHAVQSNGCDKAVSTVALMNGDDYCEVLCCVAIPWMLFSSCLNRLHSAFNSKCCYGQMRAIINETTDKLNEATSVKPLIDSLKEGTDQDVSTAAVSLGHTFASLNRSAKNRVNRHLVGAIEQLRINLDKDIAMFTQLGELGLVSHTEKLAWSNTPTEASFATLKYFDLSKSTMKLGNIVQLTIGHVNRIAEWMTDCDTTPAERKELLDARVMEQRRLDQSFLASTYGTDFEI